MCGRFSFLTPLEEIRNRFGVDVQEDAYRPRFNLAPSQDALVIPEESPYRAEYYHWGLVPHWAKDKKIGSKLINARAETIDEKPSFRNAFRRHRCLVLADGFYEWDKKSSKHVPYRITMKNNKPFAFAGICEYWKDEKGDNLKSFSIVTTKANSLIASIHDRMPVILSSDKEREWLSQKLDIDNAKKLLRPIHSKELKMYQITTAINNPKNDTAEVLKSVV